MKNYYVDKKCTVRTRTFFQAESDEDAIAKINSWGQYNENGYEIIEETLEDMTVEMNQWEHVTELYNDETWKILLPPNF